MSTVWSTRPLGDVCDVIGGGTPAKDRADFYDGDTPWATVRDMRSDLLADTEYKITAAAIKSSATKVIPKNNVIIATRVGLGKVCVVQQDTAINQDLRAIIPKNSKELLVRFLFWWLKSLAHLIVAEGTGATVQGVKLPFIKALRVPILPLSEQHRIVAILDETSAGLARATANAEKNLKNSRELFESYLNSVFIAEGRDWEQCKLGQLVEIKHGFAFESEYYASEGEYVLLTPGNFFEEGGYRDRGDKQKYYVGKIPDGYILKKGDFLVAMTEQAAGLLGSSIIIPEDNKFLHNQRLGLVQLKPGTQWSNEFFFHAFNTKRFRRAAHDSASGVKVRHTSPTKLGDITISYPRLKDDQVKVAKTLDNLLDETERLAEKHKLKLLQIAELKRSILQKAFSGELTSPVGAIKEAAE